MRERGSAGRDPAAWAVAFGATLLLLGPALGPRYVLIRDMVVVPRMSMLPEWFGLGDPLPRAVPQDAVMAALSTLAPGWVWQQLMLVGALVLAGVGAARLAAVDHRGLRLATVVIAIWNPWVAERLLQGNLSLLLAYGSLPWLLGAARRVRDGETGALPALLGWTALGSLVPTAGVMSACLGLVVALGPGSRAAHRWRPAALVLVLQLPWVVPAVTHPAADASDATGALVFALRSEGWWGAVLTAVTGGGVWNADAVPTSRTWWWSVLLGLLLVAAAAAGFRAWSGRIGRAVPWALTGWSALALGWALTSSWGPTRDVAASLVGALPGGGLLRDAHKWLGPGMLLVAAAAPHAVTGWHERSPSARRPMMALAATGLALLPLLAAPDLAFGVSGRVRQTAFPAGFDAVRQALQADQRPGDVLVLPFAVYRAFDWNGYRVSGDPGPRLLPRSSVADDSLAVARPDGTVVVVAGEDPRSAEVAAALVAGRPLAPLLAAVGVGSVLVESGTPGEIPARSLVGLTEVAGGPGARLLRVPGVIADRPDPAGPRVVAVVTANAAAAVVLGWAAWLGFVPVVRRRRRRRGREVAIVPPNDQVLEDS